MTGVVAVAPGALFESHGAVEHPGAMVASGKEVRGVGQAERAAKEGHGRDGLRSWKCGR